MWEDLFRIDSSFGFWSQDFSSQYEVGVDVSVCNLEWTAVRSLVTHECLVRNLFLNTVLLCFKYAQP